MVMIMKDVFKCVALVVLGIITAVFLYPILHETGHSLATVLCGAEVEEITLFPLPSVLCKMGDLKASAMVMIGFGGMALPYLLTVFPAPKNFWIWYIWFLVKGITLLSFAISVIAIDMYFAGNPMANEDMTQILKYAPEYSVVYTMFLTVMGVGIVWQIVRSNPLKRCMKQFDLQQKSE